MVQINFAQKTVNVKIVYYGPGMSGKTTNLEVVHQRAPEANRGDLTSISTDGDRTLFFDYMPLELGTVAGMRTCFQLYTVPGQVYYNSTRKLVLQGVDGVIFIADSSAAMMNQNLESLRNLEENLNEYGKSLSTMPHVIQFNKRDLPDAMSVQELSRLMNPHNVPIFEAIANTGQGVFPTLKALAASVIKNIMNETGGGKSTLAGAAAPAPAPAMPAPRLDVNPQRAAAQARPNAPFPAGAPPAHAPHAAPPHHGAPVMPHASAVSAPAHAHPSAGYGQPQGGGFFPGGGGASDSGMGMGGSPPQGGLQLSTAVPGKGPGSYGGHAQAGHARPEMNAPAQPRKPSPPARPAARHPSPPEKSAKPRSVQKQASAPGKPRSKGSELFTGLFIVVGAGVGAFLAWVVMTIL